MDRRNGGESLAPPRPPKSLPRVHRPRAPEPPIMSASNLDTNSPTAILHSCHIPQQIPQPPQSQQQQSHNQICTNNQNHLNRNNNNNISNNNINNNLNRPNSRNSNIVNSNININNINNNNNSITTQRAPLTAPLIPLHSSTSNLSNISNLNNLSGVTTGSTNLSSTNSFTRRRPHTPIIGLQILPPPTTPLLSSSNLILHNNIISNNEPSSLSPVTLAAPRPESERLSNEYVDTPLRSATAAVNLHHATRIQHPAGQTIRGQTTTSHNLLQNQRQHLQLHSNSNINNSTHHLHHHNNHQQAPSHSSNSNIINNNCNISNSNNERHRQTSNVPCSISTVGGGGGSSSSNSTTTGSGSGSLRQNSGLCGIDSSSNTLHSNNISHKNIVSSSIIGTTITTCNSNNDPISTRSTTSSTATTTTTTTHQNQRIIPGTVVRQSQNQQQQQTTNNHSTILPITEPITKQPAPFSKECLSASILNEELDLHHLGRRNILMAETSDVIGGSGSGNSTNTSDYINSITCPQCKKCRCEQCQSPRPLPSKWVCNKTCLCSAETVIDYASCLCCVKALFYHCSKDHEMECDDGSDSISCADEPCSCLPHKRATRWGWLGALSLVLPCLWCYWPMKGCIALCAKCYARHARHGCRCNYQSQIGSTSSMLPIAPAHGNQITTTKSNSNGGINNSGNNGNGSSGGNGNSINSNNSNHHHCNNTGVSRLIRTNDLTPEKRLLDSSPEY